MKKHFFGGKKHGGFWVLFEKEAWMDIKIRCVERQARDLVLGSSRSCGKVILVDVLRFKVRKRKVWVTKHSLNHFSHIILWYHLFVCHLWLPVLYRLLRCEANRLEVSGEKNVIQTLGHSRTNSKEASNIKGRIRKTFRNETW